MRKHKLLSFLLALIASVALWVYAVTVVNPDDTKIIKDVKVSFVGLTELEAKQLMVSGGEGQRITVEVSGRRSDLKELTSTSLEVIADVGNIDRAGTFEVTWNLDPPSTVASGDISVVSSSSNRIRVTVSDYLERNEIPVTVAYTGTLEQDYFKETEVLSLETVTVSGPAEEVQQIDRAVATVSIQGVTETITKESPIVFVDEAGNELTLSEHVVSSAAAVRITVPVWKQKTVQLKYEIIDGGGATADDVNITLTPGSIVVYGTQEALAEQPDEIVVLTVDLATLEEIPEAWTVTPKLNTGVKNRAEDPNVTVSMELIGLMTRTFTIACEDFQVVNSDAQKSFAAQSITVTVRGREAVVTALDEKDIRITADMKNNYDAETKSVTLKIELPNGCGVLKGPYTVPVTDES